MNLDTSIRAANDTTADPEAVIRHRGEHADSSLTSAQIAAFLRADIKAAMKAGGLPTMKVSVTAKSYSMGQSVTVRIVSAPFAVMSPAWVFEVEKSTYGQSDLPRHTPRAMQVRDRIEAMAAEYVRSDFHGPSDLHNCNCYMHVNYDHDLETSERAAVLGAKE
jgi:hypothetical protein